MYLDSRSYPGLIDRLAILPILALIMLYVFSTEVTAQECPTDSSRSFCGWWTPTIFPAECKQQAPGDWEGGYSQLVVMKTGQVFLVNGGAAIASTYGRLYVPSVPEWNEDVDGCMPFDGFGADAYCASHAQLPDGRIAFVGLGPSDDFAKILFWNPDAPLTQITETWLECLTEPCLETGHGMPHRWFYPSTFTLATGKLLTIGGNVPEDYNACEPVLYDGVLDEFRLLAAAKHDNTDGGCPGSEYPDIRMFNYPHLYQATEGGMVYVGGFGALGQETWVLEPEIETSECYS